MRGKEHVANVVTESEIEHFSSFASPELEETAKRSNNWNQKCVYHRCEDAHTDCK